MCAVPAAVPKLSLALGESQERSLADGDHGVRSGDAQTTLRCRQSRNALANDARAETQGAPALRTSSPLGGNGHT